MALATNSTVGEVYLNGDIHTSNDALSPELTATGVAAGTYNFPHLVVDGKGRVLYAEEADMDDVPCATDSTCGLVKIGDTLWTGGSPVGEVNIPIATDSSLGIVQPDSNFTINTGLLSYAAPIATGSGSPPQLGNVIVGANLEIDAAGILSRGGSGDGATTSSKGIVQIGEHINIAGGIISVQEAENATMGVVQSADIANILISAGNINVGSNVALKNTVNTFTKAQNASMQTLTNVSGNITLDASIDGVFEITCNGDTTIDSISNLQTFKQVDIIIHLGNLVTDYTLTLNPTFFKISGNTTAGHTTLISCTQITDGTDYAYCIVQPYMI